MNIQKTVKIGLDSELNIKLSKIFQRTSFTEIFTKVNTIQAIVSSCGTYE